MVSAHRSPPWVAESRFDALSGLMSTTQSSDPILLTVPEAARRLSIGRTLTYELIAAGELPSVHLGRAIRIPARALDEFVARRLEPEAPEAYGARPPYLYGSEDQPGRSFASSAKRVSPATLGIPSFRIRLSR